MTVFDQKDRHRLRDFRRCAKKPIKYTFFHEQRAKNMLKKMIIFSLLHGLMIGMVFAQPIKEYKRVTGLGVINNSNDTIIVVRQFIRDSATTYLTVDPESLSTSVVGSGAMTFTGVSWETIYARFAATPYIKALKRVMTGDDSLQNAGIKNAGIRRFSPSQQGINLTVDLCPSGKPLDRGLFTRVVREIGRVSKPVPLAVAISGRWMNSHEQDFQWLIGLVASNDLAVIWINHSYNHYTSDSLPLRMNFLLEKGTDLTAEVLKTEIALLRKGLRPSVFFRFPGLVSEKTVFTKIVDFGLIPVGSDAWLSKGQKPQNGSIVLVHANGNDPRGVSALINLLTRERPAILMKRWTLLDLRESVAADAEK
jgi:hypothetical protein